MTDQLFSIRCSVARGACRGIITRDGSMEARGALASRDNGRRLSLEISLFPPRTSLATFSDLTFWSWRKQSQKRAMSVPSVSYKPGRQSPFITMKHSIPSHLYPTPTPITAGSLNSHCIAAQQTARPQTSTHGVLSLNSRCSEPLRYSRSSEPLLTVF